MPSSIVCGVDQSEAANQALRLADHLRDRLGLQLVLAHAARVPAPISSPAGIDGAAAYDPAAYERAVRAGRDFLEQVAVSNRLDNVRLRAEFGSAADWLLRIATEEQAELIVVGSRGQRPLKAAVLGSVSTALATSAPCPVVVVGADAELSKADDPLSTIVCGLDDSDGARAALRVADMIATWLGARLVLAHVAPNAHLPGTSTAPGAADDLRRVEIDEGTSLVTRLASAENVAAPIEQRVAFGTPGGALADIAEEESAGLVVVGSRGRGTFKSAVLGSVSTELIRSSPSPVVVVPPQVATASRPEVAVSEADRRS